MSEFEFEKKCCQVEQEPIEKLFENMSLSGKQKDLAVMLEDEGKLQNQQKLTVDLEQHRQSVVFESAQEQVAVLDNLLANCKSGWHKILNGDRISEPRPPPQAYLFKDIYDQKKQKLLEQQQERERAQRQFRSRPMPDFSQAHRQLIPKHTVHRITCAISPNVLKASRIMLQKRNQKIEQLLKQRDEELRQQQMRLKSRRSLKFKFESLKPTNDQMGTEGRPFPLYTEMRAERRKIFHAKMHEMQEARRREKEEQRERLERMERRKKRQMAQSSQGPVWTAQA